MKAYDIIQVILFLMVLLIVSPLLGRYIARIFIDENHILKSIGKPKIKAKKTRKKIEAIIERIKYECLAV